MKYLIVVPILFLNITHVLAQDLPAQAGGGNNNILGHSVFAGGYDTDGTPFTAVNKRTSGTTVLNENWGKGQVKFQSGFLLKNTELQFDLYSNELHFRKDSIGYSFVDPLKEFSMEFMDNGQIYAVFFRSGYPPIQQKTTRSFYQVLADGEFVQLLNYKSKEVRENYTYGGPQKNEYQVNNAYFIYDVKAGKIKNFNMNKSSLLKALPSYKDLINKFENDKNYNFRSENEVIELFKILNQP